MKEVVCRPITTILQNKIKELFLSENLQVLWKFSKPQNPQLFYFANFQKFWKWAFFDFEKKKPRRTGRSNKIKELPNTGIDFRPLGNREDRSSVPIGLPGYDLKSLGLSSTHFPNHALFELHNYYPSHSP